MYKTESDRQEEFIKAVGGYKNAEKLQHIYENSFPHYKSTFNQWTRAEVFRYNAKADGFTNKMIDMFLML